MKRMIQWMMVTLALVGMVACGGTNVAETQECTPGANRCTADGSVETCTDSGQFVFSKQCAVDEQCSAGVCESQTTEQPCTSGTHNCDANATCVAQDEGAYLCTCNEGFSGNGFECINNNACTGNADCDQDESNWCLETVCDNGLCTTQLKNDPTCCETAEDCTTDIGCSEATCVDSFCNFDPIANCCQSVTDCYGSCDQQTPVACENGQCVFEGSCCSSNSECDDEYLCTADTCVNGSCQFEMVDDCCLSDAECIDNNPCTDESCGADNQCAYTIYADCCTQQSDCDDNMSCSTDSCINNSCVIDDTNCCSTDGDCPVPSGNCKEAKCDGNTGNCGVANKPNGTSCGSSGTCQGGLCQLSNKEVPKSPGA